MNKTLCLVLLLGIGLTAMADDDSGWKAGQFPQDDASRTFLSQTNGLVTVNVNSSANSSIGRFTVGTADGRRLLYGHGGDPSTSWVKLQVDGTTEVLTAVAGPTLAGDGIVMVWAAGDVQLTQTTTPVSVDGQGTVRIEYDVHNQGAVAHDVGVLLQMDTMVNNNDAAPISTSYGYAAVETCFDGAGVPNTWSAFEQNPSQDPALLVGCGVLQGLGATLPDRFAVGRWTAFYDADFGYACANVNYGDSAVLLWWSSPGLAAGGADHFQTYYGTCTELVMPGNLSLSLGGTTGLSCEDGELVPNPFDVNLLVTNTGGDVCHDVTATIVPGPGLTGGVPVLIGDLAPGDVGAAGFFLTVLDGHCDMFGTYTVDVSSADCDPNSIGREIWVPCCETAGAHEQPFAFRLDAACPNPFNPTTVIGYSLSVTGQASLQVYDLGGRPVATLVNGMVERGAHSVTFDASDLASGVYFAVLTADGAVDTKKMVLIR